MAYKQNDEKLISKNLKALLKERKLSQVDFAPLVGYERSYITKWISGSKIPNKEQIERIAEVLHVSADELYKNISIAIVHTSALLDNVRILGFLIDEYAQVIVPNDVIDELEEKYDKYHDSKNRRKARKYWLALMKIKQYSVNEKKFSIEDSKQYGGTPKQNIIKLANDLKENQNGDVYIIHNDGTLFIEYKDSLLLREYMAKRKENIGYYKVLELMDEWDAFEEIDVEGVNLNAYLPDGMTLLINCIRCNDSDAVKKRGGLRISSTQKIQKVKFLLDHGADIDETDNSNHCLSPLAHCIQCNDFELFDYLLQRGADYNRGSRDTLNTSNFRMQNEGNTPLMVACYHGNKRFVDRFLKLQNVSYNQQDANGFTALIKTAWRRNELLEKNGNCNVESYTYIYEKLSAMDEVDKKIRDLRNKTAEQYWKARHNKESNYEQTDSDRH